MKTIKLFFLTIAILTTCNLTAQVAINTNGTEADGSAMLDVQATDKGFLPPRMTEAERNAIGSPAAGLIVWCSNCGSNGELQVYNGSAWTNAIGGTASVYTPAIGDYYQGGVIFYLDGSGGGLICAINDQDGGEGGIPWDNAGFANTGATATAIGGGQANTTAIIAEYGAGGGANSYAASACDDYTYGGYADWFLPSKEELNEMYLNKTTIESTAIANGGSGFANEEYWSSSDGSYTGAYQQNFSDGTQVQRDKNCTYRVRAVRVF